MSVGHASGVCVADTAWKLTSNPPEGISSCFRASDLEVRTPISHYEGPRLSSHPKCAVTSRAMCGRLHQLGIKAISDQKPICQPNPMMPAWQLTAPAFLRGLATTNLRKVPSERWRVHSRTPSVACCLCLS